MSEDSNPPPQEMVIELTWTRLATATGNDDWRVVAKTDQGNHYQYPNKFFTRCHAQGAAKLLMADMGRIDLRAWKLTN